MNQRIGRRWSERTVPVVVAACVAVVLQGCASQSHFQSLSAGLVGAPPGEIGISNLERGFDVTTWVATYAGARYQCTAARTAVCTRMMEAPPRAAEAQAPVPIVLAGSGGVSGAPPRGAAGLLFDADPETEEKACVGAGYTWKAEGDDASRAAARPQAAASLRL